MILILGFALLRLSGITGPNGVFGFAAGREPPEAQYSPSMNP